MAQPRPARTARHSDCRRLRLPNLAPEAACQESNIRQRTCHARSVSSRFRVFTKYVILTGSTAQAGGNIDPIDVDATTWSSFFPEPALDNIHQSTDLSSRLTAPELQALKLCALRETFEESGVLLLEPEPRPLGFNSSVLASLVKKILPGSSSSLKEGTPAEKWSALSAEKKQYWREEVHRDGKRFVDLLRSLGHDARPALSLLTHWSNWV